MLNNTISSWLNSIDTSSVQDSKYIQVRHPEFFEVLSQTEKTDISSSGNKTFQKFNLVYLILGSKSIICFQSNCS